MEMTDEQKAWFLYGYVYAQAQKLKKEGLFEDLTIKELTEVLVRNQSIK